MPRPRIVGEGGVPLALSSEAPGGGPVNIDIEKVTVRTWGFGRG